MKIHKVYSALLSNLNNKVRENTFTRSLQSKIKQIVQFLLFGWITELLYIPDCLELFFGILNFFSFIFSSFKVSAFCESWLDRP